MRSRCLREPGIAVPSGVPRHGPPGTLFRHDARGLAKAIEDIRAEAVQLGASWQDWRLDVVDPSGNVLPSIPLEPIRR